MKKYRILNLYACLGGNRYKWDEVLQDANISDYEIVAVELDTELARLYQERFPNDIVIIADAHQYLLDNYKEFDFIWTSPPCPSHSRARYWGCGVNGKNPIYPDLKLYEEIIFLENHCKTKYCVENVISYYEPLIKPQERDRHYYWCNFILPKKLSERHFEGLCQVGSEINKLSIFHDYDFTKYKGEQRLNKIARNLVDYEAGKTILSVALNCYKQSNQEQLQINF